MARRRFTPAEISAFQYAVASGAKLADVAREHGFSRQTFARWQRRYGTPVIPYTPTPEERERARAWRKERSPAAAWRVYSAFARDPRWEADGELPVFEEHDEFERLILRTRPDARVVLVCEKMVVLEAADRWDPKHPSVAHASAAALAWIQPLPSAWTCQALYEHAARLKAPLLFLGDLDPQALHLFAALRAGGPEALMKGRAGRVPIRWIGLDGRWLGAACRQLGVGEVPLGWKIRLGWLDQEYWELTKRLVPDYRRLLGARGCALLDAGMKIEVDALLHRMSDTLLPELRRRLTAAR